MVQFLSVGKELGVNGLLEEIVNNDANISREDDVSDVQTNEKVENRSQQREGTSGDIVKEMGKRVVTDGSQQGNIKFGCNKCEAVYRYRTDLYRHVKSIHEGVKYDCN